MKVIVRSVARHNFLENTYIVFLNLEHAPDKPLALYLDVSSFQTTESRPVHLSNWICPRCGKREQECSPFSEEEKKAIFKIARLKMALSKQRKKP